jgi:hypothetical protein
MQESYLALSPDAWRRKLVTADPALLARGLNDVETRCFSKYFFAAFYAG